MLHNRGLLTNSLIGALFVLLTACGGSGGGGSNNPNSPTLGDNDSNLPPNSASLSIGLTDGPVEEASEVVVTFTSIELQGPEKRTINFDSPKVINLLDYQGEQRILLLDDLNLASGEYQWIRLGVKEDDSYIVINGSQFPLEIPSGAQTGLKLNNGFTLATGSTNDFTIDFDLRKSVIKTGAGDYKLKPTLRLVNNLQANTIEGTVLEDLITDLDCNNGDNNDMGNTVYLFSGENATVQDLQDNDNDPLTTATVTYDELADEYQFTVGFVPLGNYTITFTCDAVLDIADEDNSAEVDFIGIENVTVTEGESIQVLIE